MLEVCKAPQEVMGHCGEWLMDAGRLIPVAEVALCVDKLCEGHFSSFS